MHKAGIKSKEEHTKVLQMRKPSVFLCIVLQLRVNPHDDDDDDEDDDEDDA